MSFLESARPALKVRPGVQWPVALMVVILVGLALACGSRGNHPAVVTHDAYITLPQQGSVRLLKLDNSTGQVTANAQTPPVLGLSPTGLALHPSKKFLYTANSAGNSISLYTIASDGTLTINASPTPTGSAPRDVVIDPSGQYLLVSNTLSNDIWVYSIDSGTGALTQVGAPVFANTGPTAMVITPSGKFVYVTNPVGFVTAFTFWAGVLTPLGTPFAADHGVNALTVDATEKFLYTANTTANNVSGFAILPSGALQTLPQSPYTSPSGTGPSAIAIDPANTIVYVTTPGASFSVWAFSIDPATGILKAVPGSPFNLLSGGDLFLVMEPRGNFFYAASQSNATVAGYQYNSGAGTPKAITGSPFTTGTPGKMVIVP